MRQSCRMVYSSEAPQHMRQFVRRCLRITSWMLFFQLSGVSKLYAGVSTAIQRSELDNIVEEGQELRRRVKAVGERNTHLHDFNVDEMSEFQKRENIAMWVLRKAGECLAVLQSCSLWKMHRRSS